MSGSSRREFLARSALAVTAGALPSLPQQSGLAGAPDRRQAGLDNWDAIRDQFALTRDYIHLGGLYLASHPTPVRNAIEAHRRGLDENPVHYLQEHGPRLEAEVLRQAAAYLGGRPAAIALTDSTTMGLGLLYNGLDVRADQEILTTQHDFYATHEALRSKAARSGAALRTIPLYRDPATASEVEIVDALRREIGPRTRVVAATWVHSSTGVKLPVRGMADAVGDANAGRSDADRVLLCIDGVHGLGVEDQAPTDLGCDFFVAGCHKWLFGPRGTGLIWARPEAWSAAAPTIPSFTDNGTPGGAMTPGGFHSFEHRWALAQAFELHQHIGKARVTTRIRSLNRQFKEGVAAMDHVTLHTPMAEELSAGMVCFDVRGLEPRAVVQRLRERRIIATTTPYGRSYARVAPGLVNRPEEIDAALAEIRGLG